MSSPEIPTGKTVKDLASSVISGLVENTEAIFECMGPVLSGGDYSVTIRDVDVYVVLSLLASIIEGKDLELRTVHLAARLMVLALGVDSKFYTRNAFKSLLQTKIHVCVMALTLDPRKKLAKVTAELIFLLWKRFAPIYLESLNEVFVKGLATALTSPDPETVSKTLAVYEELVKQPRLFVNSFINYDCDDTGYFPNVFANTVNQIVKLSYPDTTQTLVQGQATVLLVRLLGSLWKYFNDFQAAAAVEEAQETAESFVTAKKTKNVLEDGMELFAKNPKKGLAFLIEHEFVQDTPEAIAQYFFDNPGLDPAGVGEILGGSGERNINILKHYVSLFNFKGSSFEHAFRQFLSSFQIPGEAQMIDRVMEQFGQKYYNDNPTLFSSPDTVYVLSFSTLMLHTDAHHPNVKSRMTLEQFLANNRGIDGGKDLPRDFLEELYNGIRSKKIFCSSGTSLPSSALLTREQRADLFQAQASEALSQARARSEVSHNERQFHKADSPLLIGPMFEAIWQGTLATLAMTFEQSDVEDMYKLCLRGLTYSVHIASHCFIDEALEFLVSAFTKFTALRLKKTTEIKQKNIDCCNTLMRIALNDGNFLRKSWLMVVDQMAALDQIRTKKLPFNYDVNLSEDLINKSGSLDRESIVDFAEAMCAASAKELKQNRQFLLQRIGLLAYFNVSREHFIWDKIWKHVGTHLASVGSLPSLEVANVAVDLLRQIADRFLGVPELTQMHFQEDFMKPFSDIFENNNDPRVKEYVLCCISGLINRMAANLQSGWNVIFKILFVASKFPEVHQSGFEITQLVLNKYLETIPSQYLNLVTIFQSFALVAEDKIKKPAVDSFMSISEKTKIDDLAVWVGIFDSFGKLSLSTSHEIRKKVHEYTIAVFDRILTEHISDSTIKEVLEGILPIYLSGFDASDNAFYGQAAEFLNIFFTTLVDKYYDDSFSRFFHSLMKLITVAIHSVNAHLSENGITVLRDFIKFVHEKMDDEKTTILLESMKGSATRVFSLTLNNGKLLLSLLVECVELFKSVSFIEIIEVVDHICEQTEAEPTRFMLWPVARSALLKALLVKQEETKDKIVACVARTLELYHTLEFAHKKLPESPAWSAEVVATLDMLNNMSDEYFTACFEKAAPVIVEIVTAQSLQVRKHVSATLKRKLL